MVLDSEKQFTYADDLLRALFDEVKTIALVGASPRGETRASWRVMRFLQNEGFKVYPVNPDALGQEIHGEKVYASIMDLPEKVDMVDIFRRSEAVPEVVEAALRDLPDLKTIWMQLGVIHEEAAQQARGAGLRVAMNRCPKIEYPRLMSGRVS